MHSVIIPGGLEVFGGEAHDVLQGARRRDRQRNATNGQPARGRPRVSWHFNGISCDGRRALGWDSQRPRCMSWRSDVPNAFVL
jgi:hypothetical protein